MPNNVTSNFSQIVLKKFLKPWENDLVLCNTVDKQIISDGDINPDTGDTLWVKRPHQYNSLRTADGDISGETKNSIISGKAAAIVQDYITVTMDYTQLEQAIKLNQLEEILAPARQRIITDLETSFARFVKNNCAHHLGSAGTQLTKWSDVSQCNSFMHAFGFPRDRNNWSAVINPFGAEGLADAQGGLASGDNGLVNSAWKDAQISRNFGGLKAMTSDSLSSHTNGSANFATATVGAAPDQTYLTGKDTYNMILPLAGMVDTQTLTAGTQLQIADVFWLNQQTKDIIVGKDGNPIPYTCTVVNDIAVTGTTVNVLVTAPAFFEVDGQYNAVASAIAGGEAVTVVSGAPNSTELDNLFYHKQAFGICTVQLPRLHATESSVANFKGFSIRVHKYSDGDKNLQKVRFDLLPAFAAYNPMLAGRFSGNP